MVSAVSIAGVPTLCEGVGSTQLTAVPATGGAPFTYLWSPGGETSASISVSTTGTYSCLVGDACGGSASGSVGLTVCV